MKKITWCFCESWERSQLWWVGPILGDPGADKGGEGSLNGRKNMARRKVKNGENPWGQCLTRLVPNGCRCSAFWLGRKTQKFSGTNTPESSAEHALFITQPNQEPSVDGRTTSTTSIINDHTFSSSNAVIHTLYQQFRVIDPEYAKISRFYTRLTSHSATGRQDAEA